MPFKKTLEDAITRITGAVGLVFVDSEGEAIEQFTYGDTDDIRIAGAQQGLILRMCENAMKKAGNGHAISSVGIRSEKNIFSLVPVAEGTFLVLVQDTTGVQSQGIQVLRETVPEILTLL